MMTHFVEHCVKSLKEWGKAINVEMNGLQKVLSEKMVTQKV